MTYTMTHHERVLVHEAGHAWVAQMLGYEVEAVEIEEVEERGLGGRTMFTGTLTAEHTMLVAVAGMAAEAVAMGTERYEPHTGAQGDVQKAKAAYRTYMPKATTRETEQAVEAAYHAVVKKMRHMA